MQNPKMHSMRTLSFFLYVTACGAYSSHGASDSLCHFQFMAKRNCQRLSSFQLPELQSSATLSV